MHFFKKSIITRSGDENHVPYLIRWTLFGCKWFSIKLHKILISDDDCMHTHPWSFITFILWNGYVEETPNGKKIYGPGRILYRSIDWIHRLEIYQPCITLVITFKKRQEWGFITKNGFIPWFKYTSQSKCE